MPTVINETKMKRGGGLYDTLSFILPHSLYEEIRSRLYGYGRAEEIRCRIGRNSYITAMGSNIELSHITDKQDMDVVTFGLGLRLQTTAFESLYNRSCPVYTRFLVKADAGDTRSHVRSSLTALPGRSGRVRSAESKRLGLEMGIGITIPIGADSGSLFMDCGYECRFDASEVNGTVGYRLSF